MKKYLPILLIILTQQLYSQTVSHDYGRICEFERDKKTKQLPTDESKKNYNPITCSVIVNEENKTITISRKYISKTGQKMDMFENYYFVKKEKSEIGGDIYYAVDLASKKYLEFIIQPDSTLKCENCEEFYDCNKFTEYKI